MLLITPVLMIAGCTQPDADNVQKAPNRTLCTDPRPQICTREYNPVCATRTDGSSQSYATGCTACADTKVISYVPGACGR